MIKKFGRGTSFFFLETLFYIQFATILKSLFYSTGQKKREKNDNKNKRNKKKILSFTRFFKILINQSTVCILIAKHHIRV